MWPSKAYIKIRRRLLQSWIFPLLWESCFYFCRLISVGVRISFVCFCTFLSELSESATINSFVKGCCFSFSISLHFDWIYIILRRTSNSGFYWFLLWCSGMKTLLLPYEILLRFCLIPNVYLIWFLVECQRNWSTIISTSRLKMSEQANPNLPYLQGVCFRIFFTR